MSWVAVAVGGASIVGGLISADASKDASNAQVQAAGQSDATQRYMFDQSAEYQRPWREVGTEAIRNLSYKTAAGGPYNRIFTMDDFQADPGYAFRVAEGRRALERSAAARGGLLSGRTGMALTRYGQDMGSQEFQSAYNRWNADRDRLFNREAALAGVGQTASRDVAGSAMTLGVNLGNNALQAGNARASGYVGGANALTGGIGQGMNFYQNQQLLNTLQNRPYTMGNAGLISPMVPGQFNLDAYG